MITLWLLFEMNKTNRMLAVEMSKHRKQISPPKEVKIAANVEMNSEKLHFFFDISFQSQSKAPKIFPVKLA